MKNKKMKKKNTNRNWNQKNQQSAIYFSFILLMLINDNKK